MNPYKLLVLILYLIVGLVIIAPIQVIPTTLLHGLQKIVFMLIRKSVWFA